MKQKILEMSDTWSTSRLSHRPRKPVYYIVDCRISGPRLIFFKIKSCIMTSFVSAARQIHYSSKLQPQRPENKRNTKLIGIHSPKKITKHIIFVNCQNAFRFGTSHTPDLNSCHSVLTITQTPNYVIDYIHCRMIKLNQIYKLFIFF